MTKQEFAEFASAVLKHNRKMVSWRTPSSGEYDDVAQIDSELVKMIVAVNDADIEPRKRLIAYLEAKLESK